MPYSLIAVIFAFIASSKFVPQNALSPILVTLSGILILDKLIQSLKALLPMLVTESGMVTEVRPQQQ